jgi:protein gp37
MSMSDLFHEAVPFEFIDKVFAVMALCPQHTFQVLTKRPERMAEYLAYCTAFDNLQHEMDRLTLKVEGEPFAYNQINDGGVWPLPWVWLGCSPVNQETADGYIPHLLRTPAAVRFLSIEPMLGPVDLTHALENDVTFAAEGRAGGVPDRSEYVVKPPLVHWVILGCESLPGGRVGRNAEHVNEQMADVVRQCRAAGVPVFVKQCNVGGRVEHDLTKFPESLRVREYPTRTGAVTI